MAAKPVKPTGKVQLSNEHMEDLKKMLHLIKQKSLFNNRQYLSNEQDFEFTETAIQTTNDYDKQTNRLKHQVEIDCVSWKVYVKKLIQLIEQYSLQSETQQNNKRTFNQFSSMKTSYSNSFVCRRIRITFSSSSSDSRGNIPK
ncbi:unnamed protein product [Rotaria sp. Silwood1]|nr:unnamed protein product [Rotaria sp. Silwood1]CAF1658421.1 unnamed protein product [Rotaria sp. Silwood1]